jgi:hypothetical protein
MPLPFVMTFDLVLGAYTKTLDFLEKRRASQDPKIRERYDIIEIENLEMWHELFRPFRDEIKRLGALPSGQTLSKS